MTLGQQDNLETILILIYSFTDDVLKQVLTSLHPAIERPRRNHPPQKKHNLSIAELATLAIFRSFTGHRDWKGFYQHIATYHHHDFPSLPSYKNFLVAIDKLAPFSLMLLHGFMRVFRKYTHESIPKFADASKIDVCNIKREWTHKVMKGYAAKSKSTMGWFYGFKLHLVCNHLMQILAVKLTPGNTDDRKGLEMIWNDLFGMIIADAGYVGKEWQDKAKKLGKHLLTGVRANMKKLMTAAQHQLLNMRSCVETVFSVLKLRFGLITSLPRSPLGYFAHYLWCLTAYQVKKFMEFISMKPLIA